MASTFFKDSKELVRDFIVAGALMTAGGTVWYEKTQLLPEISNHTIGYVIIGTAFAYIVLMIGDYLGRIDGDGKSKRRTALALLICAVAGTIGWEVISGVAKHIDSSHRAEMAQHADK